MAPKFAFALAAVAAAFSGARAVTLTLNDYVKFADGSADLNPPTCGLGYSSLDLTRITAYSGITGSTDSKCGSCVNVCGSAGCDYLLVVDMCTLSSSEGHLDISTAAGPKIVGSDTGNHVVTMEFVDVKNCAGIWDGRMFQSWDEPNANLKALQSAGSSSSSSSNQGYFAGVFAPGASSAAVASSSPAPAAYSTPEAVSSAAPVESSPAAYSSPSPVASSPAAYSTPEVYSTPSPTPTPTPSSTPAAQTPSSSIEAYPTSSPSSAVGSPSWSLYSSVASSSSSSAPSSASQAAPSSSSTPAAYSSSSPSATYKPTGASSSVITPSTAKPTTFASVYGTGAPSGVAAPTGSNGTIVAPSATASPSQPAFEGASAKTTTTMSGLAMSFLLVAMVVLA